MTRSNPSPIPETTEAPPQYQISSDRRVWLILGVVAMLLSGCCVSSTVIGLAWGDELLHLIRR